MVELRIALGLALNSDAEHRWRRVAVPLASFLFALSVLASASVVAMIDRQNERDNGRGYVISTGASRSDVLIEKSRDLWDGRRIDLVWIEPVDPTAPDPALPAGVSRFPAPGEAVLSPELARLADEHPVLDRRYPRRTVLGDAGVFNGNELIAFVRPEEGRHVGDPRRAVHIVDGQAVGSGSTLRVSAFGGSPWLRSIDVVKPWQVAFGALALCILPGAVVLVVGIAAASVIRDRRLQLLGAIGLPRSTLRRVAVGETLALALPGVGAAGLLWGLIDNRVTVVPVVGYRLVVGDFALPWPVLLVVAVAVVGVCAALAAVLPVLGAEHGRTRATTTATSGSLWSFLPVALAAALFLAARLAGTSRAADLNLMAMVLAVAGTPLVMPRVLRGAGEALAGSRSAVLALVGRGMEWDPRRAVRPFVGLGALIVVVLATAGYVAVGEPEEPLRPGTAQNAVLVQWLVPEDGDLARLRAALPGTLVVPMREGAVEDEGLQEQGAGPGDDGRVHEHQHEFRHPVTHDGRDHQAASVLTLYTDCGSLSKVVGLPACSGRDGRVTPAARDLIVRATGPIADGPVRDVLLAAEDPPTASVVVLATRSIEVLDAEVRTAAVATLPAPLVVSAENNRQYAAPTLGWLIAGAGVAAVVLGVGCVLAMVDRILGGRRHHRMMLKHGLLARHTAALGAAAFVVPLAVVATVATGFGVVICANIVNPGYPFPWAVARALAAAVLSAGVMGTVFTAALTVREASREPE